MKIIIIDIILNRDSFVKVNCYNKLNHDKVFRSNRYIMIDKNLIKIIYPIQLKY